MVLKPEFAETVLQCLRKGMTEKEISLQTHRHKNTISRYVKYLRTNYHLDFKLLTNEVISELQTRINEMEDRDLVRFLACLLPQKIEASGEISGHQTIVIRMWNEEDDTGTRNSNTIQTTSQTAIVPQGPLQSPP